MEGWKKVGNPYDQAKIYELNGIDELLVMDIVASLYDTPLNYEPIRNLSKDIYIPITFGGGIRSEIDARNLLSNGADKVCINTAAVKDPCIIEKIAKEFGSQAVSIAIDIARSEYGDFIISTEFGRNLHNIRAQDWIQEVINRGAGEIIVTSISKDGTGRGFDLNFLQELNSDISVPLVIGGGFGQLEQLSDLFSFSYLDGVVISSAFHKKRVNIVDCKDFILKSGYDTRE